MARGFSIRTLSPYNEENSPPVCITDYDKLIVLGQGIVNLDVPVDGKSKVVNLCNVFYAPRLENYLLSVDTIEKVDCSILAKKEKMTVFDDNDCK